MDWAVFLGWHVEIIFFIRLKSVMNHMLCVLCFHHAYLNHHHIRTLIAPIAIIPRLLMRYVRTLMSSCKHRKYCLLMSS